MVQNCIFCKIIKGEIPSEKILENENFIVIKDAHPQVKGHSLVISKKHYDSFSDLPEEIYKNLLETIKQITSKLEKDFNLIINNGKNAGQEVSHFHLHILPRKENDGFKVNL